MMLRPPLSLPDGSGNALWRSLLVCWRQVPTAEVASLLKSTLGQATRAIQTAAINAAAVAVAALVERIQAIP